MFEKSVNFIFPTSGHTDDDVDAGAKEKFQTWAKLNICLSLKRSWRLRQVKRSKWKIAERYCEGIESEARNLSARFSNLFGCPFFVYKGSIPGLIFIYFSSIQTSLQKTVRSSHISTRIVRVDSDTFPPPWPWMSTFLFRLIILAFWMKGKTFWLAGIKPQGEFSSQLNVILACDQNHNTE